MAGSSSVDTRHPLYKKFKPLYQLVQDCVEGELAIKERTTRYLPRPDGWTDNRYAGYIGRACFMNATGRTRAALVGIAMSKPASVELSPQYEYLRDDVDGEGQSMVQLYRDALTENLTTGRGGVLVDTLNIAATNDESASVSTVRAEQSNRFMLRHFKSLQVINWRKSKGKLILLVLEYDDEADNDGFDHAEVRRWIELRMVNGLCYGRLWERNASIGTPVSQFVSGATGQSELVPIVFNGKHLDHIPFAWYGSENNDEVPDVPPLSDIASLNRGHYQNDADVSDAANLAGKPTIAASGLSEAWAREFCKGGISIGGEDGVLLPTGGSLDIVQANETTMSAAQQERREKQMAMLGAKMVERGTGARTATQAGDEAQTDNSVLSQCAGNVESAINLALRWVGNAGDITVNKKYESANVDSQLLTAMVSAVQSGNLLLRDFIRWSQNNGLSDETLTPEQIEDELRNQQPVGMSAINAAVAQAAIDARGGSGNTVEQSKDEEEQ